MSQIDGRQPVVVRLGDDSTVTGVQAASFEDAFGYSEFGGKGRARRTKRKAARQTKKMTRIANKTARKTARKVGRQTAKTAKIAAKSAKKDVRLQGRLNRKAARKDSRGSAEEEIPEMEEEALSTEDLQPEAYAEQDYSEPEESDNYETAEDAGGEDSDSDYEQSPSEDEEGYEGDEDYDGGGDDGEALFTGDERESSFNAENENPATIVKIGPAVMDKARRLYWNQLMANRVKNKMSNAEGDPMELQVSLDGIESRIQELESQLEGYSNAKGGGRAQAKAARKEVKAAKKAVRQEARAAKKVAKVEKKAARVENRMAKRGVPPPPVEVAEDLGAETTDDSIEVPAEEASNFGGDGYGYNDTKTNIKPKHVLIVLTIALAAYGLYKYSTIKKGVKA
ncbi:MAG: hypothetical protein V4547_17870 [Bacteroidota bacterium]